MRSLFLFLFGIMASSQAIFSGDNARLPHSELIVSFSTNSEIALSLAVDSIHQINCLHAKGYIHVVAGGGVTPYTYQWSNGLVGQTGNSLAAGTYSITATDATNATAVISVVIQANFDTPDADAGPNLNVDCSNELITINGSGSSGIEFDYHWTAYSGGSIFSGANTLTPLANNAGVFMLVVTDTKNGCTASSEMTIDANIQAPTATVTGGELNCVQSQVTLGAVYTTQDTKLRWQGPGNFMSLLAHPVVNTPGNYVFILTDTITGCITTALAVVTTGPYATASGGGILTCYNPTATLGKKMTLFIIHCLNLAQY